ncbi:MAG: cyclic di-GMP phosphodiesterase [Solirubrobacterales bacterium]|jgi:putative nucleotidyltransferase with HDIG domain|nr:cyclic di-GMP phosphodiesterase [Solirubrobacterales bacterium]
MLNNLRGGRNRAKSGFLAWAVVLGSVATLTAMLALGLGREEASGVLRVIWAIPIAIVAVQFGFRGGIAGAMCALALVIAYEATVPQEPSLAILLAIGTAYLAVGGLLGRFVDERRALEAALERHYALSLDLIAKEAEEALRKQSEQSEQTIRDRTKALEASRLEVLQRLAIAAEYRDDDTNQHTERVGRTAARIARQLGLSEDDVRLIRRAAPLHDIGKVGVPDAVLLKSGELTDDEYRAMQKHVQIGANILAQGRFPILHLARTIALSHHERWDGSGYPFGLKGDDIPLVGQITAVADVFDALTHERPYKPAWKVDAAVAEIEKNAGGHFSPKVVEAFLTLDHSRLMHPAGGLRPANWGRPRETAPISSSPELAT